MGKKDTATDNPQATEQGPWHTMTVEETISKMGLPADLAKTGLSVDEAASRLTKYGPNKMTEKEKVTIWTGIWKKGKRLHEWDGGLVSDKNLAEGDRYEYRYRAAPDKKKYATELRQ